MGDSDVDKARKTAINLLARREHSTQELSDKLTQRGYQKDCIATVLTQLQQQNLQSDQRYAEAYVRARAERGYGPLRLEQELQQRGVAPEIITTCLAQSDMDWCQLSIQVLSKKFGTVPPQDFASQSKQKRFLLYRGFVI